MSNHRKVAEMQQQFSPKEMMTQAESFALSKTSKSFRLTLGLSIMAGLFIGLAFIFYTTVTTGADPLGWGPSHLIGGIAFSLGLIFIVVCGGELFTSTVLSLISLANKKITLGKMLRTWTTVYLGNFLGAAFLVLLAVSAKLYNIDGGQWGLNALSIAQHKLHHSPAQAFSLGVLCNLLVCLAMWMTLSTENIASKVLLVIMPVALFVSTGFEHCVANMFMVPLGILVQEFAPVTFWSEIGVPASQFADLTWSNFISHNLIYVTLGNIVGGGILIGLGYRAIFQTRSTNDNIARNITNNLTSVSHLHSETVNEDFIMTLSNTLISSVMDANPVSLNQEMNIGEAVRTLDTAGVESAPVINEQGNLVGFFSTQDLLIELWCQDYRELDQMSVKTIMKTDVQTVNPSDSLLHLAEYIAIDHDQLYPVTSMGIATTMSTLTTAERARNMQVNRPRQFPVVKDDKLLGMVTRRHVVAAFESLLTSQTVEVAELEKQTA
jgi:formate transporter FocA